MLKFILAVIVALAGPALFLFLIDGAGKDEQPLVAFGVLIPAFIAFRVLLRSSLPEGRLRKAARSALMVVFTSIAVWPVFRDFDALDFPVIACLWAVWFYHVMAAVRRLVNRAIRKGTLKRSTAAWSQVVSGAVLLVPILLAIFVRRINTENWVGYIFLSSFVGAWQLGKGARSLITLALKRRGKTWNTDLTFGLWLAVSGALGLCRVAWGRPRHEWELYASGAALIAGVCCVVAWARRRRNAAPGPGPEPAP